MAKCAGCPAEVAWLHNDKTGKAAPVDTIVNPEGNVTVDHAAGTYHVLTKAEKADYEASKLFDDGPYKPRFTLHFATCPKSAHFRRCAKCHKTPCVCA